MRVPASLSLLAVLAALLPARADVPNPAAALIPPPGLYTVACLPWATCDSELREIAPDRYALEWRATDRMGETTFCRYTAELRPGPADDGSGVWSRVLTGTLDGTTTRVLAVAMEGDRIWMRTDRDVCAEQRKPPRGSFGMNGFYDRLFGDE